MPLPLLMPIALGYHRVLQVIGSIQQIAVNASTYDFFG